MSKYILKQSKQNLYYKGKIQFMHKEYDSFSGDKKLALKYTKDEADKMAESLNLIVEEYNEKGK